MKLMTNKAAKAAILWLAARMGKIHCPEWAETVARCNAWKVQARPWEVFKWASHARARPLA